ncbi:ribonuclease P protein component [Isoptericola sp. NPDC057391]|uniref:ribonuclease P protein component n=1 Tax=Isoptericola sp. NPDC057391 TaxID=3346117 RepID=UPI003630C7B8
MLPAAHRLRRSVDFERTVRRGTRAGRSTVVVHLLVDPDSGPEAGVGAVAGDAPSQVGLVVSKAVGNAVHRNRVKRRLRHIAAAHLAALPAGARMVVRALPASGGATYAELDRDLTSSLDRAVARARRTT